MKKMSNKGFTLIELLAVITIMGILMMVAIPAVSRTIENSRRDTFVDNVKTYINTVRNAVLADELVCFDSKSTSDTDSKVYSATEDGYYFYRICTANATGCNKQGTEDLMETVAKSSWGSAELYGVVMWHKQNQKTNYSAIFADSALHGMTAVTAETQIKRGTIHTNGAKTSAQLYTFSAEAKDEVAYECVIDGGTFNVKKAGLKSA